MDLILLVFAFVFFLLAAIPYPPTRPYQLSLIAAGLMCWVASLIF